MDKHIDKTHGREPVALNCLPGRTSSRAIAQSGTVGRLQPARAVTLIVLLLALGWALGSEAVAATEGFDASLISQSGFYVVEYRTHPSPIPTNKMFEMTVNVRQRLKKSLARNVTLEVDAGMSEHNHGMNTMPVVERLPSRQFRVRGMLFHMKGKWELMFAIKRGIMVDKAEQVLDIR